MRAFVERHPNLTTWFVLAVGMVVVLAWSARDVELSARQFLWLAVATVLLAGLCAWIISWEADEPAEDEASPPGDAAADAKPPIAVSSIADHAGGNVTAGGASADTGGAS